MATTINELARERRAVVSNLRRTLKGVDTQQEKLERYLNRLISRKRKIPELDDLAQISTMLANLLTVMDVFEREVSRGFPL